MLSPEGQDYWSTGVYRDIVPMERIVCTNSFADSEGNVVAASYYGMHDYWPLEMVVTVTFEEDGGKTIMTLRHDEIPRNMKRTARPVGADPSITWQGSSNLERK